MDMKNVRQEALMEYKMWCGKYVSVQLLYLRF